MAASKLISSHLRRRNTVSLLRRFSLLTPPSPPSTPLPSFTHSTPYTSPFRFFSSNSSDSFSSNSPESFATNSSDSFSTNSSDSFSTHDFTSITESELRNLGYIDGSDVAAAGEFAADSILPVRAVISFLDGFHDLTGLPWWIVIASSTVAFRLALFPWFVLQLRKLKQIGEVFPKLPPPFPPPLSGKSYIDQFSLFQRERRAHKCPSFLWLLAGVSVQLPCFLVWMASIRTMSLGNYPGFDTGGILWFQDLTEPPNGLLGPVLPLLMAGLYFSNIQVAFRTSSIATDTGLLGLLVKWYARYLKVLTVPVLFLGFYLPQGSLFYWVTNSSLSLLQQLCLQDPAVRQKLGLPDKEALKAVGSEKDVNAIPEVPRKKGVSAFDLPPLELVHLSVNYLSTGKTEKATRLLRLAVEKDPECFRAWTVLAQIMLQKGLFNEAAEYSECAIAKIFQIGEPSDAERTDFLIQASLLAGAACHRQGKSAEAHVHFERVKDMKEPEQPESKARYYEALVVFASVLANEGRKDEAARYLRMAIAYDPEYTVLLNNLNNSDDFVSDLASSRRADY